MTAIKFEHVTKTYTLARQTRLKDVVLRAGRGPVEPGTAFTAVQDISFTVQQGEAVALLGPNGSGKSTVLKMLAGVVRPTSGVIRAQGKVVPLLELGSGFHPDLTARENVYLNGAILGIPKTELARSFDQIVEFSGVESHLDVPVKFFSSGMVVRLGFAIAVNVRPDILLIDEVLAVGDADFRKKSMERMQAFRSDGVTILLVTHDYSLAKSFCDRALILNQGRLETDGSVREWNT